MAKGCIFAIIWLFHLLFQLFELEDYISLKFQQVNTILRISDFSIPIIQLDHQQLFQTAIILSNKIVE
jgi:hypothetical protein